MVAMDRKDLPLFSISIVTTLTELSPRQIRYYEEKELISPTRSKGKQRLFSFNDVDRLLEIKQLKDKGVNIAGIKEVLGMKEQGISERVRDSYRTDLTEDELHSLLRKELMESGYVHHTSINRGDLSRFYHS
ncbi:MULTISPECIES: MerR family transcriptional regulator [Allobacillus]|uniref:MerR family transcriptional regulator n=1 Tax=Allobacillus salarius TaxID=1955272 RepID=A0A556PS82_9BACI|nr:MerR family transcriptional regulator [Allobacillus salarius]TSJ67233.1 MerR family transcriptional regulator [Allobacillus salarius]